MLNAAFSKQIKTTFSRFQSIKASMPRRESARRNHPLACECDIIETCYMRLSLLQMSMGKHIERGHCCFFPGAVSRELYQCWYSEKLTLLTFPFSDIGWSASYSKLYQYYAQAAATLSGDRWALRSLHHGHGIFQGPHWAHTSGSGLLQQGFLQVAHHH